MHLVGFQRLSGPRRSRVASGFVDRPVQPLQHLSARVDTRLGEASSTRCDQWCDKTTLNPLGFGLDVRLAEPTVPLRRHDRGVAEDLLQGRQGAAGRRAESPSCEAAPGPASRSLPSAREPRRCPLTAHSRTGGFRQPCEDRLEHLPGDHERAFRFVPRRSLTLSGNHLQPLNLPPHHVVRNLRAPFRYRSRRDSRAHQGFPPALDPRARPSSYSRA